jgi:hypothetical protein
VIAKRRARPARLLDPIELLEQLAALTLRPRINLLLYYGRERLTQRGGPQPTGLSQLGERQRTITVDEDVFHARDRRGRCRRRGGG